MGDMGCPAATIARRWRSRDDERLEWPFLSGRTVGRAYRAILGEWSHPPSLFRDSKGCTASLLGAALPGGHDRCQGTIDLRERVCFAGLESGLAGLRGPDCARLPSN